MSPTASVPDHSVPVTTVPAPWIVNARSMCSTAAPSRRASPRGDTCSATRSSAAATSATPSPVRAEHATTSAPGNSSAASAAARSGDARSAFVIATTPCSIPSAASTSACSSVCGITPSSAATTMR